MKVVQVNLNQTFVGMDDSPVPDDKGVPATMRAVMRIALMNEYRQDGEKSSAEAVTDKLRRFDLCQDIRECKTPTMSFSPEDAEMIAQRIGMGFGAIVAAPAIKLLRVVTEVSMPPSLAA